MIDYIEVMIVKAGWWVYGSLPIICGKLKMEKIYFYVHQTAKSTFPLFESGLALGLFYKVKSCVSFIE